MDDTGAVQLLVMMALDASDKNLQHSHAATHPPSTITTRYKKKRDEQRLLLMPVPVTSMHDRHWLLTSIRSTQ